MALGCLGRTSDVVPHEPYKPRPGSRWEPLEGRPGYMLGRPHADLRTVLWSVLANSTDKRCQSSSNGDLAGWSLLGLPEYEEDRSMGAMNLLLLPPLTVRLLPQGTLQVQMQYI